MATESVSFGIFADDRASSKFRDVGNAALDASAKMDIAAASAKLWSDTSIKQGRAADTAVAAMKSHTNAANLLADAENVLAGKATTTTKLMADQGRALDDTAKKTEKAASATSGLAGLGGLQGGGMGALIGAGVALAPVIATVGVGLTGLAAAAYGIYKPIANAAQATGGLQANLHKLNPEQQQVALSMLALGKSFAGFEHALQPVVLGDFNQGLALARTLLHAVEPVAAATGKAFGVLLGQINATFQSGTWQNFFAFMARTAGPDIQLLGRNFTDLMMTLPPLLEQLQPVSTSLLSITDAAIKLVGWTAKTDQSLTSSGQHMNTFEHITSTLRDVLFSPGAGLLAALKLLHITGGDAGKGISTAASAALVAGPKFFSLDKTVRDLNTDMTKLVGNLLTLQGSELSWQQALQSAETQLKSNSAGLEGNSKNALANRQAVLQSTNAALQFASQQLTLGKNIDGADRTVQKQITWLQGLHDKSKFVRDEIHALRQEEQLLEQQKINQLIHVQGLGQWQVSQSLAPGTGHRRAAGGLIPGSGNSDTYPALLTPGEVVVPKGMVSAGAVDHLRGSLPGFASGGLVPNYSGSPGGLTPWVKGNDAATIRLIDLAVVKATVAGIKAAEAAARAAASAGGFGKAGPGGGAPAANAALARRMMPSWGSGAEWAAWNYVAMRESGWSQFARNPSSGAYGIPQALPPSKMGPAANPPQSNPAAQISWMIGYIRGRYGDPIGAANHERAFNWYDQGGWLHPGVTMAVNNTGKPERVLPPGASGGALVHVDQMVVQDATDAELVAHRLNFAITAASLGS